MLRFTNNNDTMTIVTGKAEQYIWCQRNSRTVKLKPNDRFLFGVPEQRIGFRLYAGGFGNSLNTITGDDNSPTLTQFYVEEYEINYQEDDIENGFANAERFNYSIDISENNTYLNVGASMSLNAVVYNGKNIVDKEVIWESTDENIATISNNQITGISPGEVGVIAKMADNESVRGEIIINILDSQAGDNYDILINPDIDYILEKEEITINASLYKNGIIQGNSLNIVDVSEGIPKDNYSIVINGNSFTIKNKFKYCFK